MKNISKKTFLLLSFLFFSTYNILADTVLTENNLHATLSIVTNYILEPEKMQPPTLKDIVPSETTDSNIIVEVHGEVGYKVFVNGVEVDIIALDGTVKIVLDLVFGENTFTLILQDAEGNESYPLNIIVTRKDIPLNFSIKGNSSILSTFTSTDAQGVTLSSDGTKAYVAAGKAGLQIVDITNPVTPILIGTLDTNGTAKQVTLSSDETKAYIADYTEGLKIIDITNSVLPTLLGTFNTSGSAYEVALSHDGSIAYVADKYEGLQIIDITNPALPTLIGTFTTSGAVYGVTLSSDSTKAYLADSSSGLQIIDISNPSNPTHISTFDTNGFANKVTLSSDDTKAYVASGSIGGLQIIDISNPSMPTLIGTFDTSGSPQGITLSSDEMKAYVADYVDGLQIIDISNPAIPISLGTISLSGYTYQVALSSLNSLAYVASDTEGLQIIDITTPIPPIYLGSMNIGGEVYTTDIALSSDNLWLYMTTYGELSTWNTPGFYSIDISNSLTPKRVGITYSSQQFNDVTLSSDNTKAYVAHSDTGLDIIDITNPASLTPISTFDVDGSAYAVTLSSDDTKAYVTTTSSYTPRKLQAVDIRYPLTPTLIANLDINGPITLSKDGTKAYAVDYTSGLQIIDISNPFTSILLATFDTAGMASVNQKITLSSDGTKVYVSDSVSGLEIIDVSDPLTPTLLGTCSTNGTPYSITLSSDESKAYAVNERGLVHIDISNPIAPKLLPNYRLPFSYIFNLAISSDNTKAYVSGDFGSELQIIDLTIDTLHIPRNFITKNIELSIYAGSEIILDLAVSSDRNDIVTIGSYDHQLTYNEYNNQVINIPITSLTDKTGQTIVTVSLSTATQTVTRTLYLTVY